MSKKTKFAIAIPFGMVVIFCTLLYRWYQDIYTRFPELDRKVARKAYRKMLWKAFTGQLPDDLDDYTDEEMDDVYRQIIQELQPA